MTDDEMVLGYLADEIWLRDLARHANVIGKPNPARLALYPESIHRRFIQHHEFSALCLIGRRLIEKLDIFGLMMRPVWISNSESCLCWSFPYSMHPSNRSPQDNACLAYFKEVTGLEGELQWWPSLDGDVPPEMQDMDEPREDYWQMSICSQPGYERGSTIDFSSGMRHSFLHLAALLTGFILHQRCFLVSDCLVTKMGAKSTLHHSSRKTSLKIKMRTRLPRPLPLRRFRRQTSQCSSATRRTVTQTQNWTLATASRTLATHRWKVLTFESCVRSAAFKITACSSFISISCLLFLLCLSCLICIIALVYLLYVSSLSPALSQFMVLRIVFLSIAPSAAHPSHARTLSCIAGPRSSVSRQADAS